MNIQNPKDTANLENMKNKLKEYYEKEKSRLEKSPWIPTEIDGLDFLLKGGLLLPFVSSGKNNNKNNKVNLLQIQNRSRTLPHKIISKTIKASVIQNPVMA